MINDLAIEKFGNDVGMAIMNRIKGSAIETKFQVVALLVEAKNDVEQEDENGES